MRRIVDNALGTVESERQHRCPGSGSSRARATAELGRADTETPSLSLPSTPLVCVRARERTCVYILYGERVLCRGVGRLRTRLRRRRRCCSSAARRRGWTCALSSCAERWQEEGGVRASEVLYERFCLCSMGFSCYDAFFGR